MRSIIKLAHWAGSAEVIAATLLTDPVDGKPNGLWAYGLVLAHLPDNSLHPYVVWAVERHELNDDTWNATGGEYCRDLDEAKRAYAKRVVLHAVVTP